MYSKCKHGKKLGKIEYFEFFLNEIESTFLNKAEKYTQNTELVLKVFC